MRYYIIAGEASGDMHASNMMAELRALDANAHFRCWGGDRMQEQGAEVVKHYRDLAFMGFTEVLMNIRTIMRNFSFCEKDMLAYKPDALILIDYPGFNLRMAKFAHKHGIPVYYYISPQIWAWKESRIKTIRNVVRRMYVILPFEKKFYALHDMEVNFVGHPLLDELHHNKHLLSKQQLDETLNLSGKPIIALLPGSRAQEIRKMLPVMLSALKGYEAYQFVVCAVNSVDYAMYENLCADIPVKVVKGHTYNVLKNAHAAIVTSGTATLETALFGVPQVVCYIAGYFSYIIARNLIKLKYISLVNLIMDKPVVSELIQNDLNPTRLRQELEKILSGSGREVMLTEYEELRTRLGGSGASKNIATDLFQDLQKL